MPGLLDGLKIASPCTVSWDSMTGDERVRACAQCRLNVYNLSDMSKAEAENLIREKEGRLCVRFFRRADGTILTKDCPVGLGAARIKLVRLATAALGLVAMIAAGVGLRRSVASCDLPAQRTMGLISQPLDMKGQATMGDVAMPPKTAIMGKVRATPQREPVEKTQ